MTPAERLRRLLKPIPQPPMIVLDLFATSDVARRMMLKQLRADRAADKLCAILGQRPPLHPTFENEIQHRKDLLERYYQERDVTPAFDWSPLAAAIESLIDDIQTGRIPS